MAGTWVRGWAAVWCAVLVGACSTGASRSRVIHVRDLPATPTFDAGWIQTDRAAAAVAMAVMEHELQLPRLDVTLLFFENRQEFQAALQTSGYDPRFAEQTASRMAAVGGYRRVLINEETLAAAEGPAKASLFAHELTHSLQYELGGGTRGTSAQWLREGFADWVGARVLAELDIQTLHDFRRQRVGVLRAQRGRVPPLAEMVTFNEWVDLAGRADASATAAKAFLAVDFLIERQGHTSVLDYFARFARSQDPSANFMGAFGESLEGFEAAFDERLSTR